MFLLFFNAIVSKTQNEVIMKKVTGIAKFKPTEAQRDWVDNECKRTGESQAAVMRRLIQEKIDAKKSS
ncbi:hypothetical protein pA_gene0070 [Vibrio phage 13VT501A]|nr:hypothetical protein pA_gene0070 [Vibrio phage 13VT501A]